MQGVGFRPAVWQQAVALQLQGTVRNDGAGVLIELCADKARAEQLVEALYNHCPPLAQITGVELSPVQLDACDDFRILASGEGPIETGCAPDAATCPDCLTELFTPDDRRYRYPFINCTNCGPRLSIVQAIPYDRANTSMAAFPLCGTCQAEYDDPANRRFHAQPNACPDCGPQLWLESPEGVKIETESDPFPYLQQRLLAGDIVALRGIGGFHLACDATNPEAVERLRQRKFRPSKPFALMVTDSAVLHRYASLSSESEALLESSAAPIVLLDRNPGSDLAEAVAPGQHQLGFMLPSSPLHHLLMAGLDCPLVMTSGNRSGQPQAISNEDARAQLAEIADLLVMHNRGIINRVDDSVVRQTPSGLHTLRRARGYAPAPLPLPPGFEQAPDLLALGGELKNSLCLLKSGRAILSQYLGDLEDAATYESWEQTIELYQQLYQHQPQALVCDMHPEYLSSKYAVTQQEQGAKVLEVQHHHAHIAACLGEHGYPLEAGPVLGICFDGTGFGSDGTLWGGEILRCDYRSSERLATLRPVALIGGSQAIREPWRNLFAQLEHWLPDDDWQLPVLVDKPLPTLRAMLAKGLNCPLSSSAGRLFDAVAAALACSAERISYEGQAAIELETLALQAEPDIKGYPFLWNQEYGLYRLGCQPMWRALLEDLTAGRAFAEIARAFHIGLAETMAKQTIELAEREGLSTIVLSGGVMQNQCFQQPLRTQLESAGLKVRVPQMLPANDGGLAFGQALVAAAQMLSGEVAE